MAHVCPHCFGWASSPLGHTWCQDRANSVQTSALVQFVVVLILASIIGGAVWFLTGEWLPWGRK